MTLGVRTPRAFLGWLAAFSLAWLLVPAAHGQSMGSSLMPANVARRYGLERAWFTQVEVGRSRGRVQHLVPYVSPTRSQTVIEVFQGPSRWLFSEHEVDAFGQKLGPQGVQQKAEDFVARLKKNSPQAGEPRMEIQVLPEVTLFVSTDQAVVQAIDGETGKTRWVTKVGNAAFPTTAPAACDQYVAVLNGSTLFVLRSTDGQMIWQRRVSGVPGAGPGVTEDYVFAPMVNGAIESYTLADAKQTPWIYKSIGRALVQPSTGFDSLAWPTDRGHLYVASSTARAIRYRLESPETIVAVPAFAASDRLIAPTVDGYVYCLNPNRQVGNIWWKFSTGETLTQSPLVVGDAVYIVSDEDNLYCLGLNDGLQRWKTPGVKKMLTVSSDRMYVVGEVGRLSILNPASGSRMAVIPLDEFDLQVTNTLTDRIYYGTKTGTVQCLREIGHPWPLLHRVSKTARPKPKPGSKPGSPAAKPAPGEDPFAAPAANKPAPGEDPFAPAAKPAGGNDEDPFGGGAPAGGGAKPAMKDDEDPFGGDAKPAPKPGAKPADDADPFG